MAKWSYSLEPEWLERYLGGSLGLEYREVTYPGPESHSRVEFPVKPIRQTKAELLERIADLEAQLETARHEATQEAMATIEAERLAMEKALADAKAQIAQAKAAQGFVSAAAEARAVAAEKRAQVAEETVARMGGQKAAGDGRFALLELD